MALVELGMVSISNKSTASQPFRKLLSNRLKYSHQVLNLHASFALKALLNLHTSYTEACSSNVSLFCVIFCI